VKTSNPVTYTLWGAGRRKREKEKKEGNLLWMCKMTFLVARKNLNFKTCNYLIQLLQRCVT
jgi:hypothetical protein